jgi:hypothetical protein
VAVVVIVAEVVKVAVKHIALSAKSVHHFPSAIFLSDFTDFRTFGLAQIMST